jgi:hypothetical protein
VGAYTVQITDLIGNVLATVEQYEMPEGVTIPLCDSRLGEVILPFADQDDGTPAEPACEHLYIDQTDFADISGRVATTNASTTVTGTGTAFTSELSPGDTIKVWGVPTSTRVVDTITSDTVLDVTAVINDTDSGLLISKQVEYRIGALARMLKIAYRGTLEFWGQIHEPEWDAATGKVTVRAHDPTLRVKHAYARYADDVVGPSSGPATNNPLDYRTIRDLIEAASNTVTQTDYPDLGIKIPGYNEAPEAATAIDGTVAVTNGSATVTGTGTTFTDPDLGVPVGSVIEVNGERRIVTAVASDTSLTVDDNFTATASGQTLYLLTTITIERGANVYDEIRRVQEARYGPEWEVRPDDTLGLTPSGTAYYAQLRTYERQGTDRYDTMVFRYAAPNDLDGTPNNVRNVKWRPGGSSVRNNVVMTTQGTQEGERGIRVFGHDLASWSVLGIFSAWENPQGGNAGSVGRRALQDYANDYVRAWSRPPNFLELELMDAPADGAPVTLPNGATQSVPEYGSEFFVGDYVRVIVDKGYMQLDVKARITQAKIGKRDAAGNVRTIIEVVPDVTGANNIATGDTD